jgi:hypothetical protein
MKAASVIIDPMPLSRTSDMNQAHYTITPIKPDFVQRARLGKDDQDQPVERLLAEGGEPLRDQLRRAMPGEAIILASYCPFDLASPYKEFGPVFISADLPAPQGQLAHLPLGEHGSYFGDTLVLRAYSTDERIVDAVVSSADDAEQRLAALLAHGDVQFVLARFAAYGCYGCRIES